MHAVRRALVNLRHFLTCLIFATGGIGLMFGYALAQTGGGNVIHRSAGTGSSANKTMSLMAPAATASPSSWIYHNGEKLVCPDCHTMHASQQHPFSPADPPDPFGTYPRTFTPAAYLLKAADPISLCVTCHDGRTGVPDVINADTNALTERSAGYFDAVDVANYRGHNLKTGLSANPSDLCTRCHFSGSFATAGVTCIDCHSVHGNGRVRNLRWASWPGYEPAAFGLFMANSALGNLGRYERANVGYGTDNTDNVREVTNMCLDCHHVFSGGYYIDRNSDGIHERHPTYDSERGSTNSILPVRRDHGPGALAEWHGRGIYRYLSPSLY